MIAHTRALIAAVTALAALPPAAVAAADDGADPMAPWLPLWTREKSAGSAAVDAGVRRRPGAPPSIRIDHKGGQDWALTRRSRVSVREGDVLELAAWVKVRGRGVASISVVTYDAGGKVREWMFAARTARDRATWQELRARIIVPAKVTAVVGRLTGSGPATVWMDAFRLEKKGNVEAMRNKDLPKRFTIRGEALTVTLSTADATIRVVDRRGGRSWRQKPAGAAVVLGCTESPGGLDADVLDPATGLRLSMGLRLAGKAPELAVSLSAAGPMDRALSLPHPFVSEAGTYLVVPMNEGISYPVDDRSIRPRRLIAYGGHGICMAFWGVTDGRAGQMAILETPDDAGVHIRRVGGRLCVAPQWDPQKGRFGYTRRVRYVFFDRGGHVAICKRYRAHVKAAGRLVTLAEKRKANPHVDRLVGAVNVWCWDRDALGVIQRLKAAGIERILWSHRRGPEVIRAMNAMPGVLTSRYDIYQDVMDPANFKHLRGVHPDWTTPGWPKDLMLDAAGNWRRGWRVRGRDGKMYPCGVLCDRRAVAYAEKRIAAELKTHPFRCRFIDTTTASSWRECYDPNHPMTRSDSRRWKMDLLRTVSEKFKLVCGSETGHDAAVPFVHYFEGMLSLGPYRVPDAGRDMGRIWDEVPERVAKFQLGHRYRLPLWELVYHDCVVAQWYWGDYNNKLPALWDKRDLFNVLYGMPPMFMFRAAFWRDNAARFARSYRTVCPVARAAGYAEMTDHRFLTPDRDVQQTRFANGIAVTVNFGEKPHRLGDGTLLAAGKHHVTGLTGR